MKQETKERFIFALLIVIKILTSARTGIDTYAVSHDILNVLLIDGLFLAFWVVLAYFGKGNSAMSIRPFAAGGAWAMYIAMLFIGGEAHVDNIFVAIVVRVAGGLALAFDTWDYISAWNQRRKELMGKTLAERQMKLREKLWEKSYKQAAKDSIRVFKDQSQAHLFSDLESDTDYREALPIMPPVPKQLTSGSSQERSKNVPKNEEERQIERESRVDLNRSSVIRRWSSVAPQLPNEFTRKDFEDICGCAKTQAFDAITYGKSIGEVVEVGRGLYQKVMEGEVVEKPEPKQLPTDTPPAEYVPIPEETHQTADDPTSRFQSANPEGEF
jgi:hypothetical protein